MFKNWTFIATCSNTRFLHLELVLDYSAQSCIHCLRRFIGRYGSPFEIVSNNGTNYSADKTQAFVFSKSTYWRFNVAAAPWWDL